MAHCTGMADSSIWEADSALSSECSSISGTCTSDILLLLLNVLRGPFAANDILVAEHQQWWVIAVVCIEVFESSVCCLRIEEVDCWDEHQIEYGPNDVEVPTEILDTNRGDFNNDEVAPATKINSCFMHGNLIRDTYIQFVAVPIAAPFVLMAKELISVGYSL